VSHALGRLARGTRHAARGWHHDRLGEPAVTIRTARMEDIDAVLALWSVARSEHAITRDRPKAVRQLLGTDDQALIVAELDRDLVGALIAAWDGWRGNMYRLAVGPAHRKRGIGMQLVRAGEESLRRRGAGRITALVAFEDQRAGGFWDWAGYPQDREIGRRVRNL
jgi:ribosomal protein S18 acetylase RimI-like enzyme